MRRPRAKPSYALLAGAVMGMIVIPIAFAGAASDPEASTSSSVKKQLKKLKKKVNQLQQQVEDVSRQAGPQGPAGAPGQPGPATGPAGGDLTGNYPNPLIGPDSIGSAEIASDTVTAADIAADTIRADEIAPDGVGPTEIADQAVNTNHINGPAITSDQIRTGAVGAGELKDTYAAVSGGTSPAANTYADQTAFCNAGDTVLSGGYAWQNDAATISTVYSTPGHLVNSDTWIVRSSSSAAGNTLFAWAVCLPN